MIFILILYLILFMGIGVTAARQIHSPEEFYVAGRKGSVFSITMSLWSTIMGSSAVLGTISLSHQQGWASAWLLLSGTIGLLCLVPMAKYVCAWKKFTLPELLGTFFGPEMKRLACIMIPVAWIGVIAAQIIGSAKIISFMTPVSYTAAAGVSGIFFISYTIMGGQLSVIKTDQWQGLLILAGILAALTALIGSGQTPSPDPGMSFPFNEQFSPVDLFILLLTYAATYIVGPDIYSRLFSARDEKTAVLSVFITALLLAPMGFLISLIGIAGHEFSFDFLKTGVTPYLIGIGLFSAMISSADTTLLTASTIFAELFTDLHQRSSIKLTRILIAIFGTISIIVALLLPNIIQTLLLAFSFFSAAFIIPAVAGLLGFRTSKHQAIVAAFSGGVLALAGKLFLIFDVPSGNILIVTGFAANAAILFFPVKATKKAAISIENMA
ncbi:MAG: sodium:solute symporter family protein [Candidatus Omnitrophota bacterium]